MDTNFLTDMAYESIVIAARFCDDLKSSLGVMCMQCKDEEEYLAKALEYVAMIRKNPKGYLEFRDPGNMVEIGPFRRAIVYLGDHIENAIRTPCAKRHWRRPRNRRAVGR